MTQDDLRQGASSSRGASSSSARRRSPAAAWRSASTAVRGAGRRGTAIARPRASRHEISAWVVVKPDDTCVIRIARSEMGQGTLTGLAQLVAEELECDWSKVATEQITPGQNLARKRVWGEMGTGGSRGIRISQDYVRRGGAAARMMLLQAAADQWKVPVGELTVADGVITHAAIEAQDQLRQGRDGSLQAHAAGCQEHQAQGSEGLEDRRQAAEAARHRRQAQRQQGLCDRPASCRACCARRSRRRRCTAPSSRATTRARSPACPASRRW